MKIAVLIVNYILVGLLAIVILTATSQPEAQSTILGCMIILPAPVLAIIYAHRKENK
jgi:hypothetical protein